MKSKTLKWEGLYERHPVPNGVLDTATRCKTCGALMAASDGWGDPEELRLFDICEAKHHVDFFNTPAFRYRP